MKGKMFFRENVIKVALPITIQSLIQASFSVVDQLMVGQFGTVNVSGVGLGSKFASMYTVIAAAVATGAGIVIAQYVGKKEEDGVSKSFWAHLMIMLAISIGFTIGGLCIPEKIMGMYGKEKNTIEVATEYLRILSMGFLPLAGSYMLSTLLRCKNYVKIPLYTSIISALCNTGLNYILIFGKAGMPSLGVKGAAWATTISRGLEMLLLVWCILALSKKKKIYLRFSLKIKAQARNTMIKILLPILICEFLWSLGENAYAVVYGRIGADACAAMTLTNPIQALMIGALTGIASAAGIIIGKRLGEGKNQEAYEESKQFIKYGMIGAVLLSILLLLINKIYVSLYVVDGSVQIMTEHILIVYAFISPVKIQNMIIAGGILRSGGKTKYVMGIDFVGTWCFGVPLAILSGLVWKLPIYQVYLLLSLEECVRLFISAILFKKKVWMQRLV